MVIYNGQRMLNQCPQTKEWLHCSSYLYGPNAARSKSKCLVALAISTEEAICCWLNCVVSSPSSATKNLKTIRSCK